MRRLISISAFVAALGACTHQPAAPRPTTVTPLKGAFENAFRIGAALNVTQFEERDTVGATLVKTHFNSITPENVLKWGLVHPRPGVYDFAAPDKYVEFGERNGMVVIGHTLVWHNQTPQWVFQDANGNPVSRDTLLERLHDHIRTVVGRYRGRIKGWDVVNEAVDEDGSLRKTPWLQIIGEDYLVKAYEWAREADPQAELYYNDYSVENAPKRAGVIALIKRLQAQGIRVAAVGLQGHDRLDWPTVEQQDTTIAAFAALGVEVNITELDIDVLPSGLDPYKSGLPDSVEQALAKRYADLFTVFLKHRKVISRITFWGVRDGDSWLNNWPVRGRTSYPLLFDRAGQPKPAFDAVIRAAQRSAVVQ